MADGHFPTLVSATRDSNSASNPMFIRLTDGTDLSLIDASGNLSTVVNNGAGAAAVNIQDGGNLISIDDGAGSITVDAVDLDIRDLTSASDSVEVLQNTHDDLNCNANIQVGNTDVSASNPVPVSIVSAVAANEVHDYDTASAVAGDASSTHTYTATGTFLLEQIIVGSSGGCKFEVQVDGATIFTGFIPKEGGTADITLATPDEAGTDVDIIRTNRQGQAQDLYSLIVGREV